MPLETIILPGAVNTAVIRDNNRAILVDCCDSVTPERLQEAGIDTVEAILLTQPRRTHLAGARAWQERGAEVYASDAAARLCESPRDYWNAWSHRWEGMNFQPAEPAPCEPLKIARTLADGQSFCWNGAKITAIAMAPIEGSMAYLVEKDRHRTLLCGEYVCGEGKLHQLWPFQTHYASCGGLAPGEDDLLNSLRMLRDLEADLLIPSHGQPQTDPQAVLSLAIQRIEALRQTYQQGMQGAESFRRPSPDFILRVPDSTSWIVRSENGRGLLIDCGDDRVVWNLVAMREQKAIDGIDALYISHIHQDHHWGTNHLAFYYPEIEIMADDHFAGMLEHPSRYRVACMSSRPLPATRGLADGESWQWNEFTCTSFFFPGQTLYHGALLVEGRGQRVLFVGDSFGPGLWMGDYCLHNRNLVGEEEGLMLCLRKVEETAPDLLYDGHNDRPFAWLPEHVETRRDTLRRRAALLEEMSAWEHPNYLVDPYWAQAFPYSQETRPGLRLRLAVSFTNHGAEPAQAAFAPMLPAGWELADATSPHSATVPARSAASAQCDILVPAEAAAGHYVVPLQITWNGRYLGQILETRIEVF